MIRVKKNRKERIAIILILLSLILFSLIGIIALEQTLILLIFLPWVVFFGLWFLFLQIWQIYFKKSTFVVRKFRKKEYTYNQIESICKEYSYTDHCYITVTTLDGKRFCFRMEDENAYAALKKLRKHHSIIER